jgi:hypothetical protein
VSSGQDGHGRDAQIHQCLRLQIAKIVMGVATKAPVSHIYKNKNTCPARCILQHERTMFRALSLKHIEKGGNVLEIVRAQSTLSKIFARIGTDE